MASPKYTVIIQWSDEEQCYVASLPEWGPYCKAYGNSYEETAKEAHEILELLLEDETAALPFPPPAKPNPKLFRYPGADVVDLPDSQDIGPVTQKSKRQTA